MGLRFVSSLIGLAPLVCFAQITTGGYADFYAQSDFHRATAGQDLNGRGYDPRHESFRLGLLEFDASLKPVPAKRLGFTLNLIYGENTQYQFSTEPGGTNKYRNFGQAYVTGVTSGSKPLTIDVGEFYTFIGYEGFDARSQDNYGRSFLYTLMQPNYHFGARVSAPLSSSTTGTVYVVNGWNEIKDANNRKSIGASLAVNMSPKLAVTLSGYDGDEGSQTPNDGGSYGGLGLPNPGNVHVDMADLIVTYQVRPNLKFGLNADYASLKDASATGWNGIALYGRQTLGAKAAAALRVESVQDAGGLRAGVPIRLNSITGTYDYNFNKSVTTRFEVRRDGASTAFFASSSGLRSERTTLTGALILKF